MVEKRTRPGLRGAALLLAAAVLAACSSEERREVHAVEKNEPAAGAQVATFGAGCFWCVEAVFERVEGVLSVESGYTGGEVENPTYRQICAGTTGHAEVCRIRFDPERVSYESLLEVFWKTHDPTTLNRQGADVGTQYRSAVFYHDESQREVAETWRKKLDEAGVFPTPIVTEIVPVATFYAAEDDHQDYYAQNPNQGYCRMVIAPKIEKLERVFAERLKR